MGDKQKTKVPFIAPLQNIAVCKEAMEKVKTQGKHLDKIIAFYGPPGFGKTFAAMYITNEYDAVLIQARSRWTGKAFVDAICDEIGIKKHQSTHRTVAEIGNYFQATHRPLIIDEMDYIITQGSSDIVRDIHDMSGTIVMIIGMEKLPVKLERWEQFHSRMVPAYAAQPANIDDARILADFYCSHVEIADDLLASLVQAANGSIRRICINLALIEETTLGGGGTTINLGAWAALKKGFWTGQTTERRFQ